MEIWAAMMTLLLSVHNEKETIDGIKMCDTDGDHRGIETTTKV